MALAGGSSGWPMPAAAAVEAPAAGFWSPSLLKFKTENML
jgi:hypothetical protein